MTAFDSASETRRPWTRLFGLALAVAGLQLVHADSCNKAYVIQKGDTIPSIVYLYFGQDEDEFYELNDVTSIKPGQTICIPNNTLDDSEENEDSCFYVPGSSNNGCDDSTPDTKEISTGLSFDTASSRTKLNKYSRFTSLGFSYVGNKPKWNYSKTIDWRIRGKVQKIKDQGTCAACWAFATISAVESTYSIINKISAARIPSLSEQQLIDCLPAKCNGGWSTDGLEYIAKYGGISSEKKYPYLGSAKSCITSQVPKSQWFDTAFQVQMYEQVNFQGALGLLLALQQQPVIVNLNGGWSTFLSYSKGIYKDSSCSPFVIDHTLVVIGYNLSHSTPFWVLQNSWGQTWGMNGYMHMALTGGFGICGIHTTPGVYPVLKPLGSNLCGVINPCGSGKCTQISNTDPDDNYKQISNICKCPSTFISVKNLDGSESCAPVDSCASFLLNPCGMGTCLNDKKGGYTCICPLQFQIGYYTDSSITCVPGVLSNGNSRTVKYVIQPQDTCYLISSQFGLTTQQLQSQNKNLNCSSLKAGEVIAITPSKSYKGCSISYSINKGDSCPRIAKLFTISLSSLTYLNPGVNCGLLYPGQQICVSPGPSNGVPICTSHQTVFPGDTCQSIMSSNNLNALTFFRMNPSLYCDNLLTYDSSPIPMNQVCVSYVPPEKCKCKRTYQARKNDVCASIIFKYFQKSISKFKALNCGLSCLRFFVGQVICLP